MVLFISGYSGEWIWAAEPQQYGVHANEFVGVRRSHAVELGAVNCKLGSTSSMHQVLRSTVGDKGREGEYHSFSRLLCSLLAK